LIAAGATNSSYSPDDKERNTSGGRGYHYVVGAYCLIAGNAINRERCLTEKLKKNGKTEP
jgi:hypothetical protein